MAFRLRCIGIALYSGILCQHVCGRRQAKEADRTRTWLATWDSIEIVGAERGCCGIAASIVTDANADANPQVLLPRARRSQLWTEPAGSITAVVLSPEDSLLLRHEPGTLVLRLGRSTALAQLQRLRPAQVLLEAKLLGS